jgi:hypothetical protein
LLANRALPRGKHGRDREERAGNLVADKGGMLMLTRITDSVKLQMELSELLFEKLGMEKCWHEWKLDNRTAPFIYRCSQCNVSTNYPEDTNPNLFTRSAFLDVWDAVRKKKGFNDFCDEWNYYEYEQQKFDLALIASPSFQYEALKWLLEQDSEGVRLTETMKKEVGDE